jgi:protein O-GlcNAc transferase
MIAEAPPHVDTLLAQAMTAYRLGDVDEAETLYGQVLRLDPGNAHGLHILGLLAHDRGDHEMAASLLARAATLHPHSRVRHNLGVVYSEMLEHDAALSNYRRAVALEPDYLDAWANLIFTLDLHPHLTPGLLREARAAFDRACCLPLTQAAEPHQNDPDPDRRLRVGYVGGDFNDHSSALATRSVILGHDPAAVEVALYSTARRHDETSEVFKAHASLWAEVADVSEEELAATIREDRIDILVDLAGVQPGPPPADCSRRKPAPVQITGWGYATGSGHRGDGLPAGRRRGGARPRTRTATARACCACRPC